MGQTTVDVNYKGRIGREESVVCQMDKRLGEVKEGYSIFTRRILQTCSEGSVLGL